MMSCTSLRGRKRLSTCLAVILVCGFIVCNTGRVHAEPSDPITTWWDKNVPHSHENSRNGCFH